MIKDNSEKKTQAVETFYSIAPEDLKNIPEDTIDKFFKHIDTGYNNQSRIRSQIDHWESLIDYDNPNAINNKVDNFKNKKDKSRIQRKVIRKVYEWIYPKLVNPFMSSTGLLSAEPVTAEDSERATKSQLLLNYQIREKENFIDIIEDIAKTVTNLGTVVIGATWSTKKKYVLRKEKVTIYRKAQIEDVLPPELLQQFGGKAPDFSVLEANGVDIGQLTKALNADIPETKYEIRREIVTEENPDWVVIDPRDIIVDNKCGNDSKKARYIIEIKSDTIGELKSQGIYSNLDKITTDNELNDIRRNKDKKLHELSDEEFDRLESEEQVDTVNNDDVITYYNGWYKIQIDDGIDEIINIVFAHDGTVIYVQRNPYPDGNYPFEFSQFMRKKDSLFGEPYAVIIEDSQKMINFLTRTNNDIITKNASSQKGVRANVMSSLNFKRFVNGQDFIFNQHADIEKSIWVNKPPELSQSTQYLLQKEDIELESLTGIKTYSTQGLNGATFGKVASAIDQISADTEDRISLTLFFMSKAIKNIMRRWLALDNMFLSEEKSIRITNSDFITVTPDDLNGNIDIKFRIQSQSLKQKKIQQLVMLLQTIGPKADDKLLREMMAKISNLIEEPEFAEEIKQPEQPDPMSVKEAELNLADLQSQIEERYARIALHKIEQQQVMAKAQETGAKAQKELASASKIKQDVVEKATGADAQKQIEINRQRIQDEAAKQAMIDKNNQQRVEIRRAGANINGSMQPDNKKQEQPQDVNELSNKLNGII